MTDDEVSSAPRRVTIEEVARSLGVSNGAVSFALNDRPGVSDETRKRILERAQEMGWRPRVRRRREGERVGVIGFALERKAPNLAVESFYAQFVAGVESEISKRSYGLLWQIVSTLDAELELYRRWQRLGTVDGVMLVDIRQDDPRIGYFSRAGALPSIVVADRAVAGGLTSISVDDGGAMRELILQLHELGHRSVLRVSGPAESVFTRLRDRAMVETAAECGITARIERSDLTARSGALLTRAALTTPGRPTAIVYENDLMALAGQGVAAELGIRVPEELSIIAWDDSPLCAVAWPPISAMSRDVLALGAQTARHLLGTIEGAEPAAYADARPRLKMRGTTAPAPRTTFLRPG
ncbi:LacI family DNA-binding transcriptional regulator [Mycetocola tolaasinivorans]|uniref:LacI family DNA-binding transcriptional regulator n=1 Tax=Mycetocola tolaasinivorans TaxID=76635 RepID=UPI0016041364|nr:LacI family DNA-binding transcriptional regulator [Mycetocola tolaasinivorans]